MIVRCPYDVIVPISELKPHPKNRNIHPSEQIERLGKILKFQGWRYPINVSRRSGFIVSGHGRLEAAKLVGASEVPVSYQDFDSDEQEYAALVSDNSIASWSTLDLSGINFDVPDLGPDFEIDLLGLRNFLVDPAFAPGSEEDQGQLDEKKLVFMECPHCNEKFEKGQARVLTD